LCPRLTAGHSKPVVGTLDPEGFCLDSLNFSGRFAPQIVLSEGPPVLSPKARACTMHPIDHAIGRRTGMAREPQGETEFRAHHVGLERLREHLERVLLSSEVQYGVRFDEDSASGEFAYSWAAIWSEN